MNYREIYNKGKKILWSAGIEDAQFESAWLLEKYAGVSKDSLILKSNEECPEKCALEFLKATERRAQREPLQYILGEWDFLSLTLFVGEGVLIPREETELLCETAAKYIKRNSAVLDLCAGSGAVGLGVCSLREDLTAVCTELYDEAYSYLLKNIEKYGKYKVSAKKYDVLKAPDGSFQKFEAILSNPPYIKTGDMGALQSEVDKEPHSALCGGDDGLVFYRAIVEKWTCLLKDGGLMAFEIGEDEAAAVSELMRKQGFCSVTVLKDFQGNDRVVYGILKA